MQTLKIQQKHQKKKNSSCSMIHNELKYFLALSYNHKCPFNSIERTSIPIHRIERAYARFPR